MSKYSTAQRRSLLAFFECNHEKYFTAKEIYEALGNDSVSLSAVYRNLSSLASNGDIEVSLNAKGNEKAYRFAASGECLNHLHMTCVNCGNTFHADEGLCNEIKKYLKLSDNFSLSTTKTVLYGTCAECASGKGH